MNECSDKVLCLACDSHQQVTQASTLQMNQGPESLSDLPKVTEQKVAELGQHHPLPPLLCPHLPFSRSLLIITPIILSLSNFPVSVTWNPLSPSFMLCEVPSPSPAWVLGEGNEGGSTAGPASKPPHPRHQLPGHLLRAAHHLQGSPQCLHWGPLLHPPSPLSSPCPPLL